MKDTVFTAISLEDLQNKFADIVEDRIKNLFTSNFKKEVNQAQQYLTRKEVSERLRISLPTLNTLTKEETLKGYRIRGRVLYKWDEVESVLQDITSTKYKRKSYKI